MKLRLPPDLKHMLEITSHKSLIHMSLNDETLSEDFALAVYDKAVEAMDSSNEELQCIIGGIFARVYLFSMTRERYFNGEPIKRVFPLIRIAAKKSMPACFIVNALGKSIDGGDEVPFTEDWRKKHGLL